MAKAKKDLSETPGFRGASLADKLRASGVDRGSLPEGPPPSPSPSPSPSTGTKGVLSACAKVVVRMEKKGHGGKTVTVVTNTEGMPGAAREPLARRLGKALGCGARVEGNDLVLQGDQRARIGALLEAEGARRVVVG